MAVNTIPTVVDRMIDPNQWYDPAMLLVGNGALEWARWVTKWLYVNVPPTKCESEDWSKYGVITSFDRAISFVLPATPAAPELPIPVEGSLLVNNRNWVLLSRAALALDANGNSLPLSLFDVEMFVPPVSQLIETQPAANVFGSGEWPHVMYFPEEWSENVTRTFAVTNRSGVAATFYMSLKMLQVRQN